MRTQAWLQRLAAQLPGWHVWYSSATRWHAVPAPADIEHMDALRLPHRLGPYATPQALRDDARERYGWDEHCDTCGVLARECGHRQPETPDRRL